MPADPTTWRGSSNQSLHYLTERFAGGRQGQPVDQLAVEVIFDGQALSTSGFPNLVDSEWLEEVASRVSQAATQHRSGPSVASGVGGRACKTIGLLRHRR